MRGGAPKREFTEQLFLQLAKVCKIDCLPQGRVSHYQPFRNYPQSSPSSANGFAGPFALPPPAPLGLAPPLAAFTSHPLPPPAAAAVVKANGGGGRASFDPARPSGGKASKPAHIMDVNADAVRQGLQTHGVSRLIHGHTHRPDSHRFDIDGQVCERIVLADWRPERAEVLVANGHSIERLDVSLA